MSTSLIESIEIKRVQSFVEVTEKVKIRTISGSQVLLLKLAVRENGSQPSVPAAGRDSFFEIEKKNHRISYAILRQWL